MKKHDNRYPVTVEGLSVSIHKDDDKSFARALRTFSKKVQDDGLLRDCRDRMHFESGPDKRTKAKKAARKRLLKQIEQADQHRY